MTNSLPLDNNDIMDTFNLYLVYHAVYLLYCEQSFRTVIALTGFIVSPTGEFTTAVPDLFVLQTKLAMCVAIPWPGTRLNHTALWMDALLLFVHLSFLFVLKFAHSVRVKGTVSSSAKSVPLSVHDSYHKWILQSGSMLRRNCEI